MNRRRHPVRRAVIALASLCAAVAILPASAAAASPKKAIWGPVERDGKSQFPIYRTLGAGIYQTALSWREVATRRPAHPRDPADPAYRWPAEVTRAVGAAHGS